MPDPVRAVDAVTGDDLVRALAVEQACRSARHALDVQPLRTVDVGSREALVAVGRLATAAPVALEPGMPLVALCSGEAVRADWRASAPQVEGSLAARLAFYEQMYAPVSFPGAPYGLVGTAQPDGACPGWAAGDALEAFTMLADLADRDVTT